MARKSSIEKDKRKRHSVAKFAAKRAELKAQLKDENLSFEERFKLHLKLAELPRDGSKTRIRNRCSISGRPRGYYRKIGMSRIALRELGNYGQIPGLVKSSW